MTTRYGDDLTVAGSILASHIQSVYATVIGKSLTFTELDAVNYPSLIRKVEKVQLVDRFGSNSVTVGTLFITTTHVIFVAEDGNVETWVVLSQIASVEKGPLTAAGNPLTIRCKNFMTLALVIKNEKDCHDVFVTLSQLSQPIRIEDTYAFIYSARDIDQNEGWDLASVDTDYQRLGVPNDNWVMCDLNRDYGLCDTYPRSIYVPASAPSKVLIASSKFRSKNRLPALSYLHPDTQATITRCSQPLAGFSARCMEDEEMFQHILRTNQKFNVLYVIDTRPMVNAMAQKASGKGFENESNYQNMKSFFFAIENIHVMRNSLQKLVEVSSRKTTVTQFLSGLESSGWLKHVRTVLETGVFIAESLAKCVSCVVHCSDGWDRTSQTISLACLLLDPFYRTIKGFQTLIEKEWLSFGHKFSDRCGHTGQTDAKETSPIFTQFLDCVWQIHQQFPKEFQFNERFLLTIHDHLYSCQYGTFLGCCQKDRIDLRLAERTYSLWGYLMKNVDDYINPFYQHADSSSEMLKLDLRPQLIRFWTGLYNRFDQGLHPREPLSDRIATAKDLSDSLSDHLQLLQRRVMELKLALGKTLKSPCASIMNDSGLFTTFTGEVTSPSPPSVKSGDFAHPLSTSLDCSFDGYNTQLQMKHSDVESGVEDLSSSVGSAVGAGVNGKTSQLETAKLRTKLKSLSFSTSLEPSLLSSSPELNTVAIRWKSGRYIFQCSCGTQLYHFSRKKHCYKCGEVFCGTCVDQKVSLPGHSSPTLVPVCRKCHQELNALTQRQ